MKEDTTVQRGTGNYFPDLRSKRAYFGAWAQLSVVQYFVAEAAVIEAWAGPTPYDRRFGLSSDLGAVHCGVFHDRDVCSPLHLLMNASFVVQGLGLLMGALLLNSALLRIAAHPGIRVTQDGDGKLWLAGTAVRVLTGAAGIGTVIVGLVPEDVGSPWHFAGAVMFFLTGGAALVVLGILWRPHTPISWFVLACGLVCLASLTAGGITAMDVPEPGSLERLMGYPVTIGFSAAGLVIAQRVRQERKAARAQARARQA
jgi:hypothetical membrane protein